MLSHYMFNISIHHCSIFYYPYLYCSTHPVQVSYIHTILQIHSNMFIVFLFHYSQPAHSINPYLISTINILNSSFHIPSNGSPVHNNKMVANSVSRLWFYSGHLSCESKRSLVVRMTGRERVVQSTNNT